MKYIKARKVLPEKIVRSIQEYVDGEFIYIPRKEGRQKAWGEKSGIRESLRERNALIYRQYRDGISVTELSEAHFLSEQSIRRIIGKVKAGCS